MDDRFRIYIDRLKDQHTELLDLSLPPDFLEIDEPDLLFEQPVNVKGKVYLAHQDLVLDLDIKTVAAIPCAICNEPTEVPISLGHAVHVVPLSEIRAGVFDLRPVLREAILLEIPLTVECAGGCLKRQEVEGFYKQEAVDEHRPFEGLSADDYER